MEKTATLIAVWRAVLRVAASARLLIAGLVPSVAQATTRMPLPNSERGVIGPIVVVLVVLVLNVLVLAAALRLRRYLLGIGERNKEE